MGGVLRDRAGLWYRIGHGGAGINKGRTVLTRAGKLVSVIGLEISWGL
jgi:hypothetical protein